MIDSIWLESHLQSKVENKNQSKCRVCAHKIEVKKRGICQTIKKERMEKGERDDCELGYHFDYFGHSSSFKLKYPSSYRPVYTVRHTFYHQLSLLSWLNHQHHHRHLSFIWFCYGLIIIAVFISNLCLFFSSYS